MIALTATIFVIIGISIIVRNIAERAARDIREAAATRAFDKRLKTL